MRDTKQEESTTPTNELPTVWRQRAVELRRWAAAEGAATALERAADDLENALRGSEAEILTLREASHASGYSVDHLGREITSGKLPNAGRKGAPRVRRGDLPKKAGALLRPSVTGHIPRADIARAVFNRLATGGAR